MSSDKIIFNFTFRDVQSGAAQGCELCAWILNAEAISRYAYVEVDEDMPFMDVSTYEAICLGFDLDEIHHRSSLLEAAREAGDGVDEYILIATTTPPFKNPVGYMPDVLNIVSFGLWDPVSEKIPCLTRRGLQFFVEPSDAAAREFSTRPVESDLEASLPQIRRWLSECHVGHQKCMDMTASMGRSGAKPVRLIHIDNSAGQPRIHIQDTATLSSFPQYVALSYCWGGDQLVKCTTNTLAKFTASIPLGTLPKTLQDAIKLTSDLGHEHLWIDALCILQDSDTEKATEIAKMPCIYGQAVVTIAASRSASVEAGFLQPRVPSAKKDVAFELSCLCSTGEMGTVKMVELEAQPDPIDTRGWTLQERLLSPRIVEFGTQQTRWSCQDDGYSDGVTDGWRNEVQTVALKPQLQSLRMAKFVSQSNVRISRWTDLVEIYTKRHLTQGTDRPLAISGIAEWFSTLADDEYLAGLWKSQIHACLLWTVSPEDRTTRPQSFQGPSWSWLCADGPVYFQFVHYRMWPAENLKVDFLSASITLSNSLAPFGAVLEGSCTLRLRGRLADAKVTTLRDEIPDELAQYDHVVRIFGVNKAGPCDGLAAFYPDCEEVVRALAGGGKRDIVALEVISMQEGPTWSSYGIVLERVGCKQGITGPTVSSFRRLGCFTFEVNEGNCQQDDESNEDWTERIHWKLDWFMGIEATTIELV